MRVVTSKDGDPSQLIERPQTEEESYHLRIDGAEIVDIQDDKGNGTKPAGDMGLLLDEDLDVTIMGGGGDSHTLLIPTEGTYTVKFRPAESGTEVELLRGPSKTVEGLSYIQPTLAVRYNELTLSSGVTAMLRITPQGVEDLRYDEDGDGVFEKTVAPTASVTGALALDREMPSLTFGEQVKGNKRLVTINAIDEDSGIKKLLYSFDGQNFQPYTKPLQLDPSKQSIVYAYADDNVGNRSPVVTYEPLIPSVEVTRDKQTNEIVVTITVRNESSAPVMTNFVLQKAELNNEQTSTALPLSVEMIAPGKPLVADSPPLPDNRVIQTLRFPATAAVSGKNAMLSINGTSQGDKFHEKIKVTVP